MTSSRVGTQTHTHSCPYSHRYNHFGGDYNETIVRQHAALLVSLGLKDKGYEYINLDAKWGTTARDAEPRAQRCDAVHLPI